MVFQEPMTSLNPVLTIGTQISEAIMLHQGASKKEALKKSEHLLHLCKVSLPRKRLRQYPHELSGGMRQRAMIAMALACNPSLLIADEPTTALDVTVQAQILELMLELQEKMGTAVLFITHDLGVISEVADRVANVLRTHRRIWPDEGCAQGPPSLYKGLWHLCRHKWTQKPLKPIKGCAIAT